MSNHHNEPYSVIVKEPVPEPFHFLATVRAHGWARLRPFEWDEAAGELSRVHQLDAGKVIRLRVWAEGDGLAPLIHTEVQTVASLTPAEQAEVSRVVRRMLRLDEPLAEFHRLCEQFDGWTLGLQAGGGRLLRCSRLFEDIIYTLCTTNITWSGTIRMVDRLTAKLGAPFPSREEWRAFPAPAAIAGAGPEFLKQETGLGYRSDYVWALAAAIEEGRLDLSSFEDAERPTDELHKALRQIKGVGSYAAATILMLLGRYEHLAIDSEMRSFVSKKYFNGEKPGDADIQAIYAPWGRWQYLAYWFDLLS